MTPTEIQEAFLRLANRPEGATLADLAAEVDAGGTVLPASTIAGAVNALMDADTIRTRRDAPGGPAHLRDGFVIWDAA